jgi:hypothetical protein
MSQAFQNSQLVVFLIVVAVLFVIAIILAVVGVSLRNKRGRTLTKSTYGDNIDEGREVGPTRDTSGRSERERSSGGVSKLSGPGGDSRS